MVRRTPHNPRTTPFKTILNIVCAILGVVGLLLGSDNSYTPPEIPLLDRKPFLGVVYGWWSPIILTRLSREQANRVLEIVL